MGKIDPTLVPKIRLYNGIEIPTIGLGTFGSDHVSATQIAEAVYDAVKIGYRHIDCAAVYANEKEIGEALKRLFDEGIVKREDLWITSKVWNDRHTDVRGAFEETISHLGLDYLDLYLVHWPFPNSHDVGVSVDSRDPKAVPYIHQDFMNTWRVMEDLYQEGACKSIGTSNMTIPKYKLLLRDCNVKPMVNEMELHPHFQQPDFVAYLVKNDIKVIGFCPIGSPARPERDKLPTDTVPIQDPTLVKIAQAHGVHPAVICIKWSVQQGQIPIPFSVKPAKYTKNLQSVTEDPLSDEEMAAIRALDKNNRFIKGQVFLWPTAKDWHDLWDEDGHITTN